MDIGTRLGGFEITGVLGAGGMGQVFRARDTRLGREVALKFLPDDVLHDAERVARFRREAQVLASLNHPHIGAIHSVEEIDGRPFLVLELVEGGTLADLIAQASGSGLQASGLSQRDASGPKSEAGSLKPDVRAHGLPVSEALALARQIAEALEAAHEKGIIHRDLKPANIAMSATGAVKVLDFGLAAFRTGAAGRAGETGGDLTHSPTITSPAMTQAGVILGTAAYMAPEQAKGRPADKRADVWAFGCVLYEMLTGTKAFAGEDVSDTLAAVLRGEPDWKALPPTLPEPVRVLLKRCLEKDRHARISDIAAARFVLSEGDTLVGHAAPPTTAPVPMPSRGRYGATIAAAVVAAVAVTGAVAWYLRPEPSAPRVMRFGLTLPPQLPITLQGASRDIVIARDGSFVVYRALSSGVSQFVMRPFDQLEATPLTATASELSQSSGARSPFLSPDGQWLGFQNGPELKRVATAGGGSAMTLCGLVGNMYGADWGPDGTIVFATAGPGGLMTIPESGGEPAALTTIDDAAGEVDHVFPSYLPGHRRILFAILRSLSGASADQDIAVYDIDTGEKRVLIKGGTNPQYVETGHLLYSAAGGLRAVWFDVDTLQVVGTPVPVLESVFMAATGVANATVSSGGTLVYVPGSGSATSAPRTLTWVTREGTEEAIKSPTRQFTGPRLSPDGRQLSLEIQDGADDIWTFDLVRGALTRQTFEDGEDETAVWSPDGRWIAYSSSRGSERLVFRRRADGSGSEETLLTTPRHVHIEQWTPDGRTLLLAVNDVGAPSDLAALDVEGERTLTPLLTSPFNEHSAQLSPDGRWLAYVSNESGSSQVFVRAYPSLEGKWQVSIDGGTQPLWSRRGDELFYRWGGAVMGVRVRPGPSFIADAPVKLFEDRYQVKGANHTGFDLAQDGRFLFVKDLMNQIGDTDAPALVVVLNWFEVLKGALPPN